MKRTHVVLIFVAFVLGVVAGVAASGGKKVDTMMYVGKSPKEATLGLLTVALKQAGNGSWENIAAKEWDKAKAAFDKALALDPKDEGNLTEVGAWYNLHGDRQTAEDLFTRAFKSKPEEIWYTVNAAGSYVGVKPQ